MIEGNVIDEALREASEFIDVSARRKLHVEEV